MATKIKTATTEQLTAWSAEDANLAHFFFVTIPAWTDATLAASVSSYNPTLAGNKTTRTRRNHAAMVAEANRRHWSAERIETATDALARVA
jgi:hypothetical protein